MINEKMFVVEPNDTQKIIAAIYAKKVAKNKTEHLCNICMVNYSNIMIPLCGHGGLCNECVISMAKVKAVCPFCRQVFLSKKAKIIRR